MTDKRISELTAMAGADVAATSDVIAIVDTSENTTKKITRQNFLSTALQSSVTDTTAGRAMIVGAFGLGVAPSAISDLTAQLAPGLYSYTASTATGGPESLSYFHTMLVSGVHGGNGQSAIVQRRGSGTGNNAQRMWIGIRTGTSGAWTWSQIYGANHILGTVSQSGGVPTGAVIERGSNANGEYVRFADGTQMCWITLFATAVSAAATWTYPAAFSGDSPVVTGVANLNAARMITIFNRTLTNCEVYSWDDTGSGAVNPNASLTAIGRWF